jgi:hypothetical protein
VFLISQTSHLKFINALADAAAELTLSPSDDLSAHKFHSDLFASGIERILIVCVYPQILLQGSQECDPYLFQTTRKASTAYYPTLHLEIARYVSIAGSSGFEIPWSLARYIGLPPTNVLKTGTLDGMAGSARGAKISVTGGQTPPGSPSKQPKYQVPRAIQLPQIKPVSPMK